MATVADPDDPAPIDLRERAPSHMFRTAFGETPIGMAVTELTGPSIGRISEVNAAFCALTGYRSDEVLGRPIAEIVSAESDEDRSADARMAAGQLGEILRDQRLRCADGATVWARVHASIVTDGAGVAQRAIWLVEDITERKAALDELVWVAMHDDLTGIANRLLVMDRLHVALDRLRRRPEWLALLYLDLDRFKEINDRYGHQTGDAVLVEVARRIASVMRPGDTVGRLGGDEFLVICNDITDLRHATRVAERVGACFDDPCVVEGRSIPVSASIGVTLRSTGVGDAEAALREADAALYRAKNKGRDRYEVFQEAAQTFAMERLDVVRDLHIAIERDRFELRYQPVFDLRSSRIVSVEALVRLRHPSKGLLEPEAFLGVAEEQGQIVEIGRWVITEACRQQARWNQVLDGGTTVSVNLSARELAAYDIDEVVAQIIEDTDARADRLVLELTEATYLEAVDSAVTRLRSLRELGVGLVLDDFGVGCSSLTQLASLPIDAIKFDPSLVARVGRDERGTAVVDAVIALSHALGFSTVAEGIETSAQDRGLRELGCDEGQGFHLCGPLTAAEMTALLTIA